MKQLLSRKTVGILGLILSLIYLPQLLFAQSTGTLTGTVNDENGEAAVGVNVVQVGTTRGTSVGLDGKYTLQLPAGTYKVQFSGVGYKSLINEVSITAGQTTTLDVTMSEGAEMLDNIIVSATRQPIRKIEATTAVDVVTLDDMTTPVPSSVSESIRQTPGLQVENYTGRIRTNILMRGFPDATANSVKYSGLLIDGLPAYSSAAEPVDGSIKFDQNIERVEVVRGSAATLFGKSTAAGVVNLISRTGGERLSGMMQQTIGNNVTDSQNGAMTQFDFNLNGPLFTKKLRFNVGGFYVNDPGFRDGGFPDNGYQLRANIDYLLGNNGEKGSIRVYGSRLNMDIQNHTYIPYDFNTLEPYEGYSNASTIWNASQNAVTYREIDFNNGQEVTRNMGDMLRRGNFNDGYHAGMRVILNLGSWTIQNHFRMQEMELGNNFNISSGFNAPTADVPVITGNLFQFVGNTANEDIINELQIRNQFQTGAVTHNLTAGVYYSRNINRPRGTAFVTIPGLTPYVYNLTPFTNIDGQTIARNTWIDGQGRPVNDLRSLVPVDRREEARNLAIFIGDELVINDKLRINIGGRYDQVNMDIDFYQTVRGGAIFGVVPSSPFLFANVVDENRTIDIPEYNEFSGSLGLNYLLTENSAVYANFLRAFRLPDEDTFTGQDPIPNPENVTEDIINIEAGYRGSVANGNFNYTVTAFYTNINNTINNVFDATTSTFEVRPEGSIRIIGAEFALNYTPAAVKGLMFNANFTYQGSEYTDFPNYFERPSDPAPTDVTGNRIQRVAPVLFNIGASYNHDYFGINFNVNQVGGERFYTPANLIAAKPITLATLGAYVQKKLETGGQMRLGLTVTNLFNTDRPVIFATGDVIRAFYGEIDGGANLIGAAPTLPRRVMLTLGYRF